MILLSYLFFII